MFLDQVASGKRPQSRAAQLRRSAVKAFRVVVCFAASCFAEIVLASTPIPNTLDEAYTRLDASLKPEDRSEFMRRPELDAVVNAHFALGLYIRNEWLRSGKSALVKSLQESGAQSYDDMSSMILHSYWRHLNGKPIRLKEQGACYRKWGSEQQKLIDRAQQKGENSYGSPDFRCPP